MVDGQRRIRRFTPRAEGLLNLIPADIGRPIDNVKPAVDVLDLESLITRSIETASLQEQEVRDREGHSYLMQIRPYRTLDNKIDGAVLSFVDIEDVKRRMRKVRISEQDFQESEIQLHGILRHAPALIFVKDLQGRYQVVSQKALQPLGLSPADLLGRSDEQVFSREVAEALGAEDTQVLAQNAAVESEQIFPGPTGPRAFLSVKFPIPGEDERPYAIGGLAIDITGRKRAEDALRFLSETGRSLGTTLDRQEILSRAAHLATPTLCDWCVLLLLARAPGGPLLAVAHREEAREEALGATLKAALDTPADLPLFKEVLQSKTTRLIPELSEEALSSLVPAPKLRKSLGEAGLRSLVSVPLVGWGGFVGMMLLASGTARRFTPLDLLTAEDLGQRISNALEMARLYRASREGEGG